MFKKVLTSTVVAFLLFSFLSPETNAATPDPSFYGQVVNSSGQSIPQVKIEALQNGVVVSTTSTDSAGNYSMWLPDGTYAFKFTSPSSDFTSLASLPLDLPRNWPMNVVLTAPSVGKSFFKGYLGVDGGVPANSNSSAAFCNNGGNPTDVNGYFTLGLQAGSQCKLSFNSGVKFNANESLGFFLNDGPTIAVNQDIYLDVVAPITITNVRVVDSSGKVLTATDGLYGVRLEVGGENTFPTFTNNNNQISLGQGSKVYPAGKTSIFTGMQDFTVNWQAQSQNAIDQSGNVALRRIAMKSDVLGLAKVYIKNSKWVDGAVSEVLIPASGGNITVVAKPNNVTSMSGRATYSDGSSATGVYISSGVQGANTGATVSATGNYRATFPSGSGTSQFGLSGNSSFTDGSSLGWEYSIKFKAQVLNSDIAQDFIIPKPISQQVTVQDGDGNLLANALVQIGFYSESGKSYTGDPAYPLMSNLPKAQLIWQARARTNGQGVAQVPAMPMSSPQLMWVSASPEKAGVWQGTNKLVSIGNGPITIKLEKRLFKISGSIKASDNFPILTPNIAYSFPIVGTGVSGGGVSTDAQNNYSMYISDGLNCTFNISSRYQDMNNPDPLRFGLSLPDQSRISIKSDIVQDYLLPIAYQKVKVVDSQGAPVIGAKVSMRVGTDSNPASVQVASNLSAFQGWYGGFSTTGLDGFASVPGLVNSQILPATINVTTDVNSRYLGKQVTTQVGDRKDIVIVLAIRPPVITSVNLSNVKAGEFFTLNGSAFLGATGVTIGGVATNFTVDSDTKLRVFAPSNTSGGTIVVTNGGGSSNASPAVTITPANLSISTAVLPIANQGLAYQATLNATGGTTPYLWSRVALGLPNGLSINTAGVISGTPLQAGTWSFTIGVTDGSGKTVTRIYSINVTADPKLIPGTPSDLKATQAAGRINLSWNPRINDNGNPILGYVVQTSTNQTTWVTTVSNTLSPTASTSFAMAYGTYYVRIAAINASGTSSFSTAVGPVLVAAAPSAPTSVNVALIGGNIRATWSSSNSNGSPITGYRIRWSQDGTNWTTLVGSTNSTATSYTFFPPARGNIYLQVAGINAIDMGNYGNSSNFVIVP